MQDRTTSRFGEYIHYYAGNYLQHGLTYGDGANEWNGDYPIASRLAKAKENLINKFGNPSNQIQKQAKNLENLLNYFYGRGGENQDQGFSDQVRKILEESIKTALGNQLTNNMELDFEHLKTEYLDGLDPSVLAGGKSEKIEGKLQTNYQKAHEKIENTINKVNANLDKAYKKINSNNGKIENANVTEKELDELKKEIKKLEIELKKVEQEYSTGELARGNTQMWLEKNGKRTTAGKLVDDWNSMMSKYLFTQARANGAIGEFIVPAILFTLKHQTDSNFSTLMNDFANSMRKYENVSIGGNTYGITGAQSTQKALLQSKTIIKMDEFLAKDINKDTSLSYQSNTGFGLVSTQATTDKVDAVIQQEDEDYRLNIKNYQFNKWDQISLFHGNLYRLVQNSPNFLNHFTNINQTHRGGKRNGEKSTNKLTIPNSMKIESRQIMKALILVHALQGGITTAQGSKTDKANFFVVNDSSNGNFYVKATSSMIADALSPNSVLNFTVKYTPGGDTLKLNNKWANGAGYSAAYRRIRALVTDFARASIAVQIPTSYLRKKF